MFGFADHFRQQAGVMAKWRAAFASRMPWARGSISWQPSSGDGGIALSLQSVGSADIARPSRRFTTRVKIAERSLSSAGAT